MSTTFEDAVVSFAGETGLSAQDVRDLLSPDLNDQDRTNLLQTYKDAGANPPESGWVKGLKILGDCEQIAVLVIPIASAVQGVYGLSKLLIG